MEREEQASEELITTLVVQKVVQLVYTIDRDLAIDGILMGLAAVIEQAPEFQTNQALRKAAEDFGKRLAHHAKVFRAIYEETGEHPAMYLANWRR